MIGAEAILTPLKLALVLGRNGFTEETLRTPIDFNCSVNVDTAVEDVVFELTTAIFVFSGAAVGFEGLMSLLFSSTFVASFFKLKISSGCLRWLRDCS